MINYSTNTKKYWNNFGSKYADGWSSLGGEEIKKKELNFIKKYLNNKYSKEKRILDIGIGTGRILDVYVGNKSVNEIWGIDYSQTMVDYCIKKYSRVKKIKKLYLCDISKSEITSEKKFDFISAIRVLKYSKNWPEIIRKIYGLLNKNGVFIFTMSNYNSINRFAKLSNHIYRTTAKDLRIFLDKTGFETLEIRGFSKIPDIFYANNFKNNKLYIWILIMIEKLLELILGKIFLGRCLFIACRKK